MTPPLPPRDERLPAPERRRLDRLCDRFEARWQAGLRPRLESYLGRVPRPFQPGLLRELLALELEYRRRRGEAPGQEEYCQRLPEYVELVAAVFHENGAATSAPPQGFWPPWLVGQLLEQVRRLVQAETNGGSGPPNRVTLAPQPVPASSFDPAAIPEPKPPTPGRPALGTGSDPSHSGEVAVPGQVLGDYELLEKIGQGGMGVVYRARQRSAGRIVALKVIRPDRLEDLLPRKRQEWLERFRQEGRIMAGIEHEHIVTVYEVGEIAGRPFYSMRYVEGRSLDDLCREHPLSNQRAATYLESVARAVHHAHTRGILHRDLTPRNILIDANDRPLVTDFGLAKCASEVTRTGEILGSPSYMSPEQTLDATHVCVASDVYTLGAALYAVLTGRPPFQAADAVETLRRVREEEPMAPRRLNPAIDSDLDTITLKCLQKEKTRRYSSAAALADDLRRYLNREPILARPVGRREKIWRWCQRNPGLTVASGLAILALIVGTAVSTCFGISQSAALRKSEEQGRQLTETNNQLAETNNKAAELALGLGLYLCEHGEAGLGILWLARSLEITPDHAVDLQRTIRANLTGWSGSLSALKASLLTQGEVLAVAYSPDGKTLVTATAKGVAQLWDAATGEPLGQPLQHQGRIGAVAFSPDSKTVVTGSWDKTACLWDVATRQRSGPPLQHREAVWAVAYSPDGKTVLTGSGEPIHDLEEEGPHRGKAQLWQVNTGKRMGLSLPHDARVYAVAFSPDGRTVLTGSADGTARLWDAASGKLLHRLEHGQLVWSVAFSPDGATALTGSWDRTARLWKVATGESLGAPLDHGGQVRAVAFSPDGKAVLTGDANGVVQLWDAVSGKRFGSPLYHDHGRAVLTVAFSPDGKSALTGSQDRSARFWEVDPPRPLGAPLQHQEEVWAVAFSPDGKTALTGSADQITGSGEARLWERPAEQSLAVRLRPGQPISAMALSSDSKNALTVTEDGTVRIWDVATGQSCCPPLGLEGKFCAVAFSPDGKTILTGSRKEAQLWDRLTGTPLGKPLRHPSEVWAVAFSPDGKTVLTGGANGAAQFWEVASTKPMGQILRHQDKTGLLASVSGIRAVAFSPDGKTVMTGSQYGTIRFWDVTSGKPIGPPLRQECRVFAVAFSPDGKTVWSGNGKEIRRWGVPMPMAEGVESIVLWTQVITGMELDPSSAIHILDAQTWYDRRRCLKALGGPATR